MEQGFKKLDELCLNRIYNLIVKGKIGSKDENGIPHDFNDSDEDYKNLCASIGQELIKRVLPYKDIDEMKYYDIAEYVELCRFKN